MRYNLGATQKPISSECFRLLSLVPEVQNDVEIVKPVLEELEVMRLSCSLGMLSSVNPKDFEMEMLEAREFDEDFALFLRKVVFGTDEKLKSEGIKVISLFGKQEGVKHELEKTNCWSEEIEINLKREDQGIYCVARKDADSSVRTLVLFGWLQDGLFQKSRLRDTATYVLRFLTCLSPDMVCCLSSEDIELLEQTVASMNSNNLDAWKSFSVAFHVERQEKEKDAVVCENLGGVLLPLKSTTQNVQLLKGSYPAFSVVEPAPAMKGVEMCSKRFDNMKDFAIWLVAESKQRNLKLEFVENRDYWCTELLKAVGSWPEGDLKAVKEELDRSLQTCTDQAKDCALAYIEERREEFLSQMEKLFDLDVLIKAKKGEEPAFKSINAYVQKVQLRPEIWSKLDPETRAALTIPLRLKNQIKAIASAFREHLAMGVDASEEREAVAKFLAEFAVSEEKVLSSGDGLWGRAWKKVGQFMRGQDYELLTDEFRQNMTDPLLEMRKNWYAAVETVFTAAESILTMQFSEENERSLRQSCEGDERKLISEAFDGLLGSWCENHEGLLTNVRPRVRRPGGVIFCDLRMEHWKPATDLMKVFKLAQTDDGTFSSTELGSHRLEPDAKVLKAFTIKNPW